MHVTNYRIRSISHLTQRPQGCMPNIRFIQIFGMQPRIRAKQKQFYSILVLNFVILYKFEVWTGPSSRIIDNKRMVRVTYTTNPGISGKSLRYFVQKSLRLLIYRKTPFLVVVKNKLLPYDFKAIKNIIKNNNN